MILTSLQLFKTNKHYSVVANHSIFDLIKNQKLTCTLKNSKSKLCSFNTCSDHRVNIKISLLGSKQKINVMGTSDHLRHYTTCIYGIVRSSYRYLMQIWSEIFSH